MTYIVLGLLVLASFSFASAYETIVSGLVWSYLDIPNPINLTWTVNTTGPWQEYTIAYIRNTESENWRKVVGNDDCAFIATVNGTQNFTCKFNLTSNGLSVTDSFIVRYTTQWGGCGTFSPDPSASCGDYYDVYTRVGSFKSFYRPMNAPLGGGGYGCFMFPYYSWSTLTCSPW